MSLGPLARVLVALRIMRRLRRRQPLGLERVSLRIAWTPLAEDLARGVGKQHRGCFWGVAPEPARGEQLPDPTRARGELVVFLAHPSHASELEIERTFEHEIAHILGRSEDEIAAMGLDA